MAKGYYDPLTSRWVPASSAAPRPNTSGGSGNYNATTGQRTGSGSGASRNANGTIIAPNPTGSATVRNYNDFIAGADQTRNAVDRGAAGANAQRYTQSLSGYGAQPQPSMPTGLGGGGGYGGGGGGGGVAPAGIDQGTFDQLIALLGQRKPKQYAWEDLDLPEYDAPEFYDFNTGQYDLARTGISEGIADARQRGTTAFDRSLEELNQYQNPYAAGPSQMTPTTNPALLRSMEAWGGAGMDAAAEEDAFGFRSDQALSSMYDLLGNAEDSYTQGLRRANAGDRMQFDQSLGTEERGMNLAVSMAQQKAMAAYEQDKFMYGKEEADRNFDIRMQEATTNNTGRNQTNQANVQQGNQYNLDAFEQIMNLILSGFNGAGKQTLTDFTGGGAMPTTIA